MSTQISRKPNLKIRFKNGCNKYIEHNSDIRTVIERVELFMKKFHLLISEDMDDYVAGHHNRKRLNMVIMTRMALILHTLRFVIALLTKSNYLKIMMMDFSSMLGQSQMFLLALIMFALGILYICLTITYQEMNNTLYTLGILSGIKNNLLSFPLNSYHQRRIGVAGNFMGIYIMRPSFYMFSLLTMGFHFIYSLIFYSKLEEKLFSALYLIIANILWFIIIIQTFIVIWVGLIAWWATTSYCKYKFNEINKKVLLGIKYSNLRLLMYAFREHNYIEIMVKQMNHTFRIGLFIIYYIGTLSLQILLFMAHHKDTPYAFKWIAAIISSTVLMVIIIVNIMCASMTKSAHKSYSVLFGIDNKNIKINTRLIFRERWKLLAFIEKLSGPPIGYYCYDLFPMNSYELYEYLYIAGSNYFLIMNFFG